MKLSSVILFPNGMISVCDERGEQVPEMQGRDSHVLRARIDPLIDEGTELLGYPRPR